MFKRVLSAFLVLFMVFSMLPNVAHAAYNTATGKPTDLNNAVCLAIYLGGDELPGEPAGHDTSGYFTLREGFVYDSGSVNHKSSAQDFLNPQILDDLLEGQNQVWGVFSATGTSKYLAEGSGLVNADGTHNVTNEQKIIQQAVDNRAITLEAGLTVEDYTIVWYVVKFQPSDAAWHVDGVIVKKDTYFVEYYGNGNTSGSAPFGTSDLHAGDSYTILGNTGSLRKVDGRDTYLFQGWNTKNDGTGTHYDPGDVVEITGNLELYAEWYLQNKYTITVETKLDGDIANVEAIRGEDTTVWVSENGTDFIQLEKSITGTYVTTVTENGSYNVYYKNAAGEYIQTDRQVTIFNKNGSAELNYYTVNYDTNGGYWAAGENPGVTNHYIGTSVSATENVPIRTGYTFAGWKDQLGNPVDSGAQVTPSIDQKTTLTAQWLENIDLTVNLSLVHMGNSAEDKHQVALDLLQDSLLFDSESYSEATVGYRYDEETNTTHYTVTYRDLPQAVYTASPFKSGYYVSENTHSGEANTDQTIDIVLEYAVDSVDLEFAVVTEMTEETAHLRPRSVNVMVLYWDGNSWEPFREQTQPVPVTIGADGTGTGIYTVYDSYAYRIQVVSFEMPDGRTLPAAEQERALTYVSDGSGLYTAQITVEPDGSGSLPDYGSGSTTLPGALVTADGQDGIPTANISLSPYTVTFVSNDGLTQGEQTLVLENQYRYPDLNSYIPVPNDSNYILDGWFLDAALTQRADNLARQYLNENVTYYAKYSPPMTVRGTVTVEGTYEVDGQRVAINDIDKAKAVMVVLQRQLGDDFVEVRSQLVSFGNYTDLGTASYLFENVPNDGSEYRIQILVNNYTCTYDNESDADLSWSEDEYTAVLGDDDIAVVDAYMVFTPDEFTVLMAVDSTMLAENFRPTGALSRILYRDLGDIHPYMVLAAHNVAPYGQLIPQDAGYGEGSINLWCYHTDGTPYEYQMDVTTLYGDVPGVFTAEGTAFNSDTSPYTIEYDLPVRYSEGEEPVLYATLVPKSYEILFDMGLNDGEDVDGMDDYFTDDGLGGEYYSALHTWSYDSEYMAFPYREGYVFLGWTTENAGVEVTNHGHISVDAAVAQDVTLVANWQKLEDTDYTVRYLERYTNKVLNGATVVTGSMAGDSIDANKAAITITDYTYVGAGIGGTFYEKDANPTLTITTDPTSNVITLYYVPTDSQYVEQVESNLHLDKTAVLEDNGSYTITLEAFTTNNPVTTTVPLGAPMDIVLVLNQAISLENEDYLQAVKDAAAQIIRDVAKDAGAYRIDHRIAIVGFAEDSAGNWEGTGLFNSSGSFVGYSSLNAAAYRNALMSANITGSSDPNPALLTAADSLQALGGSNAQYGLEIANNIFAQAGDEVRNRVVILFAAEHPGSDGYEEDAANAAIAAANTTKNTYGAKVYTCCFDPYGNLAENHPTRLYLKGVSSNYPDAQSLTDVYTVTGYTRARNTTTLNNADVFYLATNTLASGARYLLSYGTCDGTTGWYFQRNNTNILLSETKNPKTSSSGRIRGTDGTQYYVYRSSGTYESASADQYVLNSEITGLSSQFRYAVEDADTVISTGIELGTDTLMQDIMGAGFVLPEGAVVTVSSVTGTYSANGEIIWADSKTQLAQLTVGTTDQSKDGIVLSNLGAANATDPLREGYAAHTVGYTGFDFSANYINAAHATGAKLVMEITGVEATDQILYGRPVYTNSKEAGMFMAEDSAGNRQLLMNFDAPSTIFIQRAYVLDYAKEFTLEGWYLTADGAGHGAVHLDCDGENGMNRFDESAPNQQNTPDSPYGNTQYGNVTVHDDGTVTYTPVTMSWTGTDEFFVFGVSNRRAVLAQDANENGNLWHKVTVIPANNVYYEDSFVTTGTEGNDISGFTFTGSWETVYSGEAGGNREQGENQEGTGSGVHGWTDDLADDTQYTDGSAHYTAVPGASVEFTFTGTGVDVYSRTNTQSGMVIATLFENTDNGWIAKTGLVMDNLAQSGDYYNVPVIFFKDLPYGSYKVQLRAFTASAEETGSERTAFWVDGIRVYNPSGMTQNYQDDLVQSAYGEETNAVFTSIREILLENGSFDADTDVTGAVFIDEVGSQIGVLSYEIGVYESYGPKNEVYLAPGQAIVLKVNPDYNYYIGLRSPTGAALTANISGTDGAGRQISLNHAADLYYKVTPIDGYLVIQNDASSGDILSLTQLRTTNADGPVEDGGVLTVTQEQALKCMKNFVIAQDVPEEEAPKPLTAEQLAEQLDAATKELFRYVRNWMES